MPDDLFRRAKETIAARRITFRSLVIDAVEKAISEPRKRFVLRDASAGYAAPGGKRVARQTINEAIDELREPPRRP